MPNYKKIYSDIITEMHPKKMNDCSHILNKSELSYMDVLSLNKIIFGTDNKENNVINPKFRSYDKKTIIDMLTYQKKYKLNDSQLSAQFNMSRNSIAKWKKAFDIGILQD